MPMHLCDLSSLLLYSCCSSTAGIFGYVDHRTILESYLSDSSAKSEEIQRKRELMAQALIWGPDWGDANMVRMNVAEIQVCLFTTEWNSLQPTPSFRDVSIVISDQLGLLGLNLSFNLNFGRNTAWQKSGLTLQDQEVLKTFRFYPSQVRLYMAYCSSKRIAFLRSFFTTANRPVCRFFIKYILESAQ